MATFTGQIIVGQGHPYHSGIQPDYILWLSENSRPAWLLQPFENNKKSKVVWIPTVENMLEDALLMIAIYIEKNSDVLAVWNHLGLAEEERIELYEKTSDEQRRQLYALCRTIRYSRKLIFTILKQSTIMPQIAVLKNYSCELELCPVSSTQN